MNFLLINRSLKGFDNFRNSDLKFLLDVRKEIILGRKLMERF